MNTCQAIIQRQQEWANGQGLPVDGNGYTATLTDNLIAPMSQIVQNVFSRGQGNELESKMMALHSSSALVYNFFEYWRGRPLGPLEQVLTAECCQPCELMNFEYEQTFPTGLRGVPPHLDVTLFGRNDKKIAVESKFTEPYGKAKVAAFQESYFPDEAGLWDNRGLLACQQLAMDLQKGMASYSYLDAHQLLKHILGLANGNHDFTLLYLWYEWPSTEATAHRNEINDFAQRVKGEVSFCSATYNELYVEMRRQQGVDAGYLNYLDERYFRIP
jgi:hypothetical protein